MYDKLMQTFILINLFQKKNYLPQSEGKWFCFLYCLVQSSHESLFCMLPNGGKPEGGRKINSFNKSIEGGVIWRVQGSEGVSGMLRCASRGLGCGALQQCRALSCKEETLCSQGVILVFSCQARLLV